MCDENHHRKLYPKHRGVTPTRSAFAKQQVSTCALHVALCRKSRGTNYCPAETITSARKGEEILHTFVFGSTGHRTGVYRWTSCRCQSVTVDGRYQQSIECSLVLTSIQPKSFRELMHIKMGSQRQFNIGIEREEGMKQA